jgi:hypothetical protein
MASLMAGTSPTRASNPRSVGGAPRAGSMAAAAAAATAIDADGREPADWEDQRPIGSAESAARVGAAVEGIRSALRWWLWVDLRRAGYRGGAAQREQDYAQPVGMVHAAERRNGRGDSQLSEAPPQRRQQRRPEGEPAASSSARAELQGRARHVCWVGLLLTAGAARLLLLLVWPGEAASIVSGDEGWRASAAAAEGGVGSGEMPDAASGASATLEIEEAAEPLEDGGRGWRVLLLLHALYSASLCWQCVPPWISALAVCVDRPHHTPPLSRCAELLSVITGLHHRAVCLGEAC